MFWWISILHEIRACWYTHNKWCLNMHSLLKNRWLQGHQQIDFTYYVVCVFVWRWQCEPHTSPATCIMFVLCHHFKNVQSSVECACISNQQQSQQTVHFKNWYLNCTFWQIDWVSSDKDLCELHETTCFTQYGRPCGYIDHTQSIWIQNSLWF